MGLGWQTAQNLFTTKVCHSSRSLTHFSWKAQMFSTSALLPLTLKFYLPAKPSILIYPKIFYHVIIQLFSLNACSSPETMGIPTKYLVSNFDSSLKTPWEKDGPSGYVSFWKVCYSAKYISNFLNMNLCLDIK